jgi:hypothetical protein
MSFQQHLMRHVWKPAIKREPEIVMIIKGKILTAVRLNDIGKVVEYGKEIVLNEYEVNRSRDLQNAITRGWVDIVYDKAMLKRAIAVQNSNTSFDKPTEPDVMELAKKMARAMAEEMIKNSPVVKEIAKEIAKEMVTEIKDNIKVEQIIVPQTSAKKIEINSADNNIFVDFKDEEAGITASINKPGNIEVQKDDLTSSLEKMKRFKRQSQI